MSRRRNLATGLVLGLLIVMVAGAGTRVQGEPQSDADARAGRQVVAESRFDVTNAPAQTELVALVVDFAPGAWTSLHTHGGQAINLVLEGEITLRHGGMDQPHGAGQSWTDSTGQVHAAGNTGSGPARLLTNFLLPKGAPQITVIRESTFGPAVTYEAKFPLSTLPDAAEIVSQVIDLSSGRRAQRTSTGLMATVVMEGEVTYGIGSALKKFGPGESWSAPAGATVTEHNASASKARVFTTYLLPKGDSP